MKGLIVRQQVVDSALDFTHGWKYPIHRLVVPEAGNLAMTLGNTLFQPHTVLLWQGFRLDASCQIVGEVDVPETVVALAREHLAQEMELRRLLEPIIPPVPRRQKTRS